MFVSRIFLFQCHFQAARREHGGFTRYYRGEPGRMQAGVIMHFFLSLHLWSSILSNRMYPFSN